MHKKPDSLFFCNFSAPEKGKCTMQQPIHQLLSLFRCTSICCFFILLLSCTSLKSLAQCPSNLDFETGNFDGWTCYTGSTEVDISENFIYLNPVPAPIPGRHTMLSAIPGDGLDEYGGFPKNCPNGSGHSIKLGNNDGSADAEGLSYEFTIPLTANKYRLTYNYAVVIQDPGHQVYEQPRMQIEIFNVTDNVVLNCSSFSFVADNSLPGFLVSPNPGGNTPVLYKDWSANTINLDGLEGKRIRFFVKTADCTFEAHFGYAYIDIVAACNSNLEGALYCKEDTSVNVHAPSGYMGYRWFNNNFSQLLGTAETLVLNPSPAPGTTVAVELTPFPGYGCKDTLIQILDTIQSSAFAGDDKTPCNQNPVQLGGLPVPGFLYSWDPPAGLSNANAPNPNANPLVYTTYTLTVTSNQGGCISTDSVKVSPQIINDSLKLAGSRIFCLGNADAAILMVEPADSIQWFWNNIPITGSNGTDYAVTQSGNYYALLFNDLCATPVMTNNISVVADTAIAGIRYPDVEAAKNFPVRLEARPLPGQLTWSPPDNLDNPNIAYPYFRGLDSRLYTIEYKTETGCVTVDTQFVKTYKKIAIYVPTVFTPNGDGYNDFLRPLLLGFRKVNYFRIYNRWGKLLFESASDLPGWNGRYKNNIQELQTIVWTIEAEDIDGKKHTQSGSTLLMP